MTKCECEPCAFCGGQGYLWIDLLGNFTSYRPDDMAEIEDCDVCDGEGTIDFCDYCQAQGKIIMDCSILDENLNEKINKGLT